VTHRLIFWVKILVILAGCAQTEPASPLLARQLLRDAWHANQHAVWELAWPNAPVGGPITVEIWQSGSRYRYEVLEAVPPALVGETLVFDGRQAWRYNRFAPPEKFVSTGPTLSPVTDALAVVDQLLEMSPQTAEQITTQVNFKPARKIALEFSTGHRLTMWLSTGSGLPLRVMFAAGGQQGMLEVRHAEPLVNPPAELFGVGPWLY